MSAMAASASCSYVEDVTDGACSPCGPTAQGDASLRKKAVRQQRVARENDAIDQLRSLMQVGWARVVGGGIPLTRAPLRARAVLLGCLFEIRR